MAERFYVQWSAVNFVTICLMAFTGIFLIGFVASAVRHYRGTADTGQVPT